MIQASDIQELKLAAAMITAVTKKLDTRTRICETCKLSEYVNWNEFQSAKELTAAANKIMKWADALSTKSSKKKKAKT